MGHQPGERLLRRGPGTNVKSNPNALATTRQGTIFTNVVHNLDDNTVWWEGLDKNPPERAGLEGRALERQDLHRRRAPIPTPASPPAKNCPCISPEFESPRACRSPPSSSAAAAPRPLPWCYQSRDWSTACS